MRTEWVNVRGRDSQWRSRICDGLWKRHNYVGRARGYRLCKNISRLPRIAGL